MARAILAQGVYVKSTYSDDAGCVAVRLSIDGTVQVGDTKDLTRDPLTFSRKEWSAFVAGVKAGEFDI